MRHGLLLCVAKLFKFLRAESLIILLAHYVLNVEHAAVQQNWLVSLHLHIVVLLAEFSANLLVFLGVLGRNIGGARN